MADTAGSAKFVSLTKDKSKAAIASKLSAEIYGLDVLKSDIQDDKVNFTRFLVFQKDIVQPDDMIITMGAGNIWRQCKGIYEAIKN